MNLKKKLIYMLKDAYFWCLDKVLPIHINSRASLNTTQKRILIIRIDAIGDFVIFSSVLELYRERFKDYEISVVVISEVKELAEACPYIDKIIVFDRKKYNFNLFNKYIFLKKINAIAYDTAIYPVYSREEFGDEIIRFTNAKAKMGFDGDDINIDHERKINNNKYYTKLVKSIPNSIHEIERNIYFIESLGAVVKKEYREPKVWIFRNDEVEAEKILKENQIMHDDSIIVICPSAGRDIRRWGIDKFAVLANEMVSRYKVKILLCGNKKDSGLVREIKNKLREGIIDLTGKVSLRVLASILKRSRLFIGNEAGILHLSVAVGTPSIAIMGGGHFGRFFPYGENNTIVYNKMDCYGCNWQCIYSEPKCIKSITVDDVFRAVQKYF